MTALTHQITSRTLVAAAFLAAALAGLIVALAPRDQRDQRALTQRPGRPASLGEPACPWAGLPGARLPGVLSLSRHGGPRAGFPPPHGPPRVISRLARGLAGLADAVLASLAAAPVTLGPANAPPRPTSN